MTDTPFVMVPREPTEAEIKAVELAIYRHADCSVRDAERAAPLVYQAVLSAAPPPPQRPGREEVASLIGGGSSLSQEERLDCADRILALFPPQSPAPEWTDADVERAARAYVNARSKIDGGDGTLWDQLPRSIRKTEFAAMRAALNTLNLGGG